MKTLTLFGQCVHVLALVNLHVSCLNETFIYKLTEISCPFGIDRFWWQHTEGSVTVKASNKHKIPHT